MYLVWFFPLTYLRYLWSLDIPEVSGLVLALDPEDLSDQDEDLPGLNCPGLFVQRLDIVAF
jgi:hypothetical protein